MLKMVEKLVINIAISVDKKELEHSLFHFAKKSLDDFVEVSTKNRENLMILIQYTEELIHHRVIVFIDFFFLSHF
jgi:hypothetical protein